MGKCPLSNHRILLQVGSDTFPTKKPQEFVPWMQKGGGAYRVLSLHKILDFLHYTSWGPGFHYSIRGGGCQMLSSSNGKNEGYRARSAGWDQIEKFAETANRVVSGSVFNACSQIQQSLSPATLTTFYKTLWYGCLSPSIVHWFWEGKSCSCSVWLTHRTDGQNAGVAKKRLLFWENKLIAISR